MILSTEAGIIQNSVTHTVEKGTSLRGPHVAKWCGVILLQYLTKRSDSDLKIWNET
jgi:hypothetical protein